jgi:hypothetical protein
VIDSVTETLRLQYRPEPVRVLFVGESPPAGATFFYAANSNLWRWTRAAFEDVYRRRWTNGQEFLSFFRAAGCYLEDLCQTPVNRCCDRERADLRETGVMPLSQRMRDLRPSAVICVMRGIAEHVHHAVIEASLGRVSFYSLRFPVPQWEGDYVAGLKSALQDLLIQGTLAPTE